MGVIRRDWSATVLESGSKTASCARKALELRRMQSCATNLFPTSHVVSFAEDFGLMEGRRSEDAFWPGKNGAGHSRGTGETCACDCGQPGRGAFDRLVGMVGALG